MMSIITGFVKFLLACLVIGLLLMLSKDRAVKICRGVARIAGWLGLGDPKTIWERSIAHWAFDSVKDKAKDMMSKAKAEKPEAEEPTAEQLEAAAAMLRMAEKGGVVCKGGKPLPKPQA